MTDHTAIARACARAAKIDAERTGAASAKLQAAAAIAAGPAPTPTSPVIAGSPSYQRTLSAGLGDDAAIMIATTQTHRQVAARSPVITPAPAPAGALRQKVGANGRVALDRAQAGTAEATVRQWQPGELHALTGLDTPAGSTGRWVIAARDGAGKISRFGFVTSG